MRIKKAYPGHARRVMMGVWSHLRQFMYTKFIVVVEEEVDVRDWKEVVWAMTTRMDPARDTMLIEHTPIDYLDFASPVSGLGSKMGWTPPTNGPAKPSVNGAARWRWMPRWLRGCRYWAMRWGCDTYLS